MKNIWNIFRADWRRLTASVVAVVVLLGLCLVPCLYAWFNILSNWDPYGTASTSRISVAVASEDAGCEVLGLEVNIGALVLQGLESNDQMGWVFVDSRAEALDGVESGDYYAALIVPEEFTEDFVSILSGDLRHPQIQYYENEKKNAIAPKITSKAKTAVQEQINTTVIGKAAEALTTAGSVFKAMGLDSEALADGIMDKLTGARQEMAQLQKVLLSLKDVMNGADGLLTAASVTIADARGTVEDADAAAGSTVQLISTGLSAADTAYSDLLTVLNNTDKVLGCPAEYGYLCRRRSAEGGPAPEDTGGHRRAGGPAGGRRGRGREGAAGDGYRRSGGTGRAGGYAGAVGPAGTGAGYAASGAAGAAGCGGADQ